MGSQEELNKFLDIKKGELLVFETANRNPDFANARIGKFKEFIFMDINGQSKPGMIIKYGGTEIKVPVQMIKDGEIRRAMKTEEILWRLKNEDGDVKTSLYDKVFEEF